MHPVILSGFLPESKRRSEHQCKFAVTKDIKKGGIQSAGQLAWSWFCIKPENSRYVQNHEPAW